MDTVEMLVRKNEGEQFDKNVTLYKEGKRTVVLDRNSGSVSAWIFVDIVNTGFYDKPNVVRRRDALAGRSHLAWSDGADGRLGR